VLPDQFGLDQNYPNPFSAGGGSAFGGNPETTIIYALPEDSQVKLQIFNMRGEVVRELVNGKQAAGFYNITWNGSGANGQRLPSGIYFYRLNTGNYRNVKKLVLAK